MGAEQESARRELLEATDEQIDDAVTYTDPMALRGLLYQLTGDQSVPATKVGSVGGYVGGNLSIGLTDPADVTLRAVEKLTCLRRWFYESVNANDACDARVSQGALGRPLGTFAM
jgi:4-hydroxyacetophenone monooxygenase